MLNLILTLHTLLQNESHLTDFIIYDLETHNTDKTRPFVLCFYRSSKIAGRYNRDLTPFEMEKCKDYCV